MRYYGDFRSLDTTVDPQGQKYRVLIFTEYGGYNPYPKHSYLVPQHAAPILIPATGYEITMADQPFVVTYEGNTENVYKPYRCSTATVSFRQSTFNTDYLNSNGTSTLVILLKWNNAVSEVNNMMKNADSGETLPKTTFTYHNDTGQRYNDYDPYKYDRFCYTVEWIGFSTPETFSMDYSHTTDTFTLNAQDALSTLQYSKYTWIGNDDATVVSFNDILLSFCKELGTYRKIYVTDTIKFPDIFADVLTKVYEQQANNFDEDEKATDKLEVLTQTLTYLNLTAIPWKNNLIITTPNAITEGWNYYFTYTLPYNGYVMNWPEQNADYTAQPQEYLSDVFAVDETSYADGGTTISTTNVFNSVKADIDEYVVDLLLPDISDTKNLKDKEYWLSTWSEGQAPETPVNYYWEHESYNSNTPDLVMYQRDWSIAGTDHDTGWAIFNEVDLHRQNLSYYPTVYVVDDGGLHVGTATDCLREPYNPTRKIMFLQGWRNNSSLSGADNDTFRTMMIARTKSVVMSAEQYLFIRGTWQFHMRSTVPSSYGVYANQQLANSSYCYVRAKINCCGKWLANDGTDSYGWYKYTWVDNETVCKLYTEYESNKKAFDTDFKFAKNNRNFDGIVVQLPVSDTNVKVGKIQCEFGRPVGCGAVVAWSATLRDFQFEIHSKAYYESRGTDSNADHNNNTKFETEIDPNNLEEYNVETLKLSSDKDKGVRYSQTIRNGYRIMQNVYNTATGNYSLPEHHITNNIANQYATPTVNLSMTLHNQIKPYSLVTWSQMANKKFVVDSTEIDYEYERQTITLSEVKQPNTLTTTRENTTRNYRRNNDLLFNNNRIAERNTTILTNDAITITGTFSTSTGYLIYTGDEVETGCITIQPNFNNATMQVSVPNDMVGDVTFTVTDRQLTITTAE